MNTISKIEKSYYKKISVMTTFYDFSKSKKKKPKIITKRMKDRVNENKK